MKRKAVILHGYAGNPLLNWYPWFALQLKRRGFQTWSPWLPASRRPKYDRWLGKLMGHPEAEYDGAVVIGHSAGAVHVLNLLMNLSPGIIVDTAVLVSPFRRRRGWRLVFPLTPYAFNYDIIRSHARRIVIVHAMDDPVCPVADAKYYAEKLGAELVILPDGGHFAISRQARFWRFPKLVEILEQKHILPAV